MPLYELLLVVRPLPKKDVVDCLKRAANLIWKEGGVLRRINYMGLNSLPYKVPSLEEGVYHKEANYFLYDVSLAQSKIPNLNPEFKLDVDLVKATFFHQESSPIPEDYACTLEEELLPPALRPSVRPLLDNKNVRTDPRRMHSSGQDEQLVLRKSSGGPGLLTILEPKRLARIRFLSELFSASGYELRIAGGAVRDIVKGVQPQDIDFATDARPEQSLEILKRHEDVLRIIVTAAGQRHGTVAVKFKQVDLDLKRIKLDGDLTNLSSSTQSASKPEYDEESPYEITTLRCDKITDGRHAEVEFISDWRQDAERRDLTINAMFLTLDEGKLVDYYNGESDLTNGVVKFVGDANSRIKEDYLRILRFFRFWSRYGKGKKPDSGTMLKIHENLDGLSGISGERLWQEMKKILARLPCIDVVSLMLKSKLFPYLGVKNESGDDEEYYRRVLERLKRVQTNIKEYLDEGVDDQSHKRFKELIPAIVFSTLIETTQMCQGAQQRMKLSNLERDCIMYIYEQTRKPQESNQDVLLRNAKYQLAMSHSQERQINLLKMKALMIYNMGLKSKDLIKKLESWQVPNFPITGHIVAQEIKNRKLPVDKIKVIIEGLKEDWAQADFSLTKEQLESLMHEKFDNLQKST